MRISDGRVIWSATDLKKAAECEFAWVRSIDAKLGRIAGVDEPEDEMMQRAIALGLSHEHAVLERYRAQYGNDVVELATVGPTDPEALTRALEQTVAALHSPARVLYQAAFAHDDFIGFADFMVRTDVGWLVQDTKLARTARVTALMQLAAYVDQLHRLGVPTDPTVELILGDGETSSHRVDDLLPVFELRRERIRQLIADRAVTETQAPIAWNDERGDLGVIACGRCATCESEVIAHRDLLLVAGMRPVHRRLLRGAGMESIDALAAATTAPEGMNPDVFASLRLQAQLQLQSPAGVPSPGADADSHAVPQYEVVMAPALSSLPRPNPGDIFFDFEGDPLYTEGDGTMWGIDYLFGWVDTSETYTALWAHSFADEKRALLTFLDAVAAMRSANPGMHIYHYAPYETSHLTAMAARYGVGEAAVDTLLRDGVFVDLYPIVKRAVRVGSRSYSIKKLEPLYMAEQVRTEDVQNGGDSIGRYVEARALAADGHATAADEILQDLAAYNKYDCVSTRRLRDWLIDRAIEAGRAPAPEEEPEERPYEASPLAIALQAIASDYVEPEQAGRAQSLRLAAAAIDYYPRESKTFWAEHFLRLREVLSVWEGQRNVVAVDAHSSVVLEDWSIPDGAYAMRRIVHVRGAVAPGSTIKVGSTPYLIYERPSPFTPRRLSHRWLNVAHSATVIDEVTDGFIIEERALDGQTWDALPIALTEQAPPSAGAQQGAIDEWAQKLISHEATAVEFRNPAWDLLMRREPRTVGGAVDGRTLHTLDKVDAIVSAVAALDHSYLAVQGPPGTGKTYVASRVIEKLVREKNYRIGVVAQSHAVVDNVLDRVIEAGVPKELVGKSSPTAVDDAAFTRVVKRKMGDFVEKNSARGFVVGGTAWDFANAGRLARGSLDLLVIDEAGQFSLASTIACSVVANRLLLLGDPQQLPQVSQGTHPEPVDTSALGWLMDDTDVLAPEFGFFLERSWRMHPAVAAAVSRLSYDGKLQAHESAAARSIEGVEAGVHPVPVPHRGNTSHSAQEAAEVLRIVENLLGRQWHPGEGLPPRPLTPADIIVVTPYNAQQQTVSEALAAYPEVRVGTVDKFQGQEAAVSITSLAASTARDAPRGLEFLLLENRINVAVSRAQCAAYVIYSPWLLDDLPYTPAGVRRLSAFARLMRVGEGEALAGSRRGNPPATETTLVD
ncbi:TM0106 family RecB-like putative nuclease [Microbacterium mitrae]|uniref:TM0106 family RecB-like putative nuclease n=1 Tax=Microbacterium mitrae TaxID=664640 RepID=A0A5C8HTJ2_9MICO|nr:bifunctional RecB family nuclease/DEAD/DEAH box helicase [Microbacterium mitrae]TXK06403.1 TM0106 family RecB-like putative nuclease [Microbacterium mitrae]